MNILRRIKAEYNIRLGSDQHLMPAANCPYEWLGGEYSGFYINPDLINDHSVIYSFGIGEDISFDREIIERFGCHVFGFDPTPKSIQWIKKQKLPAHFNFQPYGLGIRAESVDFYLPTNPLFVSGSSYLHQEVKEKISVPMKPLSAIMADLGHGHIDVLKMDIEGGEYEIIDYLIENQITPSQLLIEFHDRFFEDGKARTRAAVERLKEAGYEIFAVSDILHEVSFIRQNKR